MASPPQFSTAEILVAARRAEAEGKLDYAIQFYRHIVDHHGQSVEAREARDGYLRLIELRRSGVGSASGVPPQQQPNDRAMPPQMPHAGPPPQIPVPAHQSEAGHGANGGSRNLPLVVTRSSSVPVEMPAEPEFTFKDRYRAGTVMAQGANWVGWLIVGIGAALGAAGVAGMPPTLASPSLMALPVGLVWGLAAAALGLALIFLSQLALAVFDNANASRHLLAIERAKAEL